MADVWNDLTSDLAALVGALASLEGTELDEQVFIAVRSGVGEQPEPLLDVAHMEEEPGDGRFQVFVTLPSGTTLDDFDLEWPPGTSVGDDSGDNATLELGTASPEAAARALRDVAAALTAGSDALVWSATAAP